MSEILNVGEYGKPFQMNVGFDISAFTALSMTFTRPDGTTFTRTNGDVTLPSFPVEVPGQGTFASGQYVKYLFQPGDLTKTGEYTVRLTYDAGPLVRVISDSTSFTVNL